MAEQTLGDAVEEQGPENDEILVVFRWDNWKAGTDDDLVNPIYRYSDPDDFSLTPPSEGPSIDYYYATPDDRIRNIDEMYYDPPEWYDPPDERPMFISEEPPATINES